MNGFSGHLVVGMERRLLQQPADVAAADPIDHGRRPFGTPSTKADEPQLRQVLLIVVSHQV